MSIDTYDIDREIIVFDQRYKLSSVIYYGGSHFVTRSLINGVVQEYDSKRSEIHYVLPNEVRPFQYRIIDYSMKESFSESVSHSVSQ